MAKLVDALDLGSSAERCLGSSPSGATKNIGEKMKDKEPQEAIDLKYEISAVNPCSQNRHSHFDSVLFLAKDRAFLEGALPGYRSKCIELGANPAHIASIDLMIQRVRRYQTDVEQKVPDTDLPCEIRRCVGGEFNN